MRVKGKIQIPAKYGTFKKVKCAQYRVADSIAWAIDNRFKNGWFD